MVIAPPIHGCWSVWRFICTTITQPHSTCKTTIEVTQKSVAHQLRTSVIELHYIFVVSHSKRLAIIKNHFLINTALLSPSIQIQRQNFIRRNQLNI